MLSFLLRRALSAIPLIFIVTLLTFVLLAAAPGDPASRLAGENATPEQLTAVRKNLGLDDPLIERYGRWAAGSLHGDLGKSLTYDRPVSRFLAERIPVTASIALLSLVLTALIALPVGILAALRPRSALDRAISAISAVGIATPPFIVGAVLVLVFAIRRDWFPATGYVSIQDGGVWGWLKGLCLPAAAIVFSTISELTRQVRAALIDTLAETYIRTARAKGLLGPRILLKHAMKNAATPIVTVVGLQVARVLSGTVTIEVVFGMPGLGTLAVEAVSRRDIPVIQGVVLVSALAVIAANLIVDASYTYFNPRLRS